MMHETLQLLRYACKLEVISRRDMERMLQSLGTPTDDKPPTQHLVAQSLISLEVLDDLWDDARLSQSLEDGILLPADVDTLRALRELHSHPERQQELLASSGADELAPIDDDDLGEAQTMIAGPDELAPIDDDDLGEEQTMIDDRPPPPIEELGLDQQQTMVTDSLTAMEDDDVGECPTMIEDGVPLPAHDQPGCEAAQHTPEPLQPIVPMPPRSTEAETLIQQPPHGPQESGDATLLYDEDDPAVVTAANEAANSGIEFALSEAPADESPTDGSPTSDPPPAADTQAPDARPPASDTAEMTFELDPSISQYKTKHELSQTPPPPDPKTAQLISEPQTAAPFTPPPRPSRLPLILLLVISLGLAGRLAQLEFEHPTRASDRSGGEGSSKPKPPPDATRLTGAQTAQIILREAERIIPPASNEDPREQLYELCMRWFQRGLAEGGKTPAIYRRLGLHLIIRWGEYQQALASLTNAGDTDPRTLWARAFAHERLLQPEARDRILAQLADGPPSPYQAAARAQQLHLAGTLEQAHAAFAKLAENAVEDPFATLHHARVLTRLGRTAAAARRLDQLRKTQPRFLAAQIQAASLLAQQPEKAAQSAALLQVLATKVRHDPACQLALGIALRNAKKLSESAETLQLLLDETPGMAVGHLELARTLLLQGQKVKAKAAAGQAVKLDPRLSREAKKLGL